MRYYLSVPFNDKDQVKLLGARWDPDIHKWYYQYEEEEIKFKKWIINNNGKQYDELSDEQQQFIDFALQGKNILVDACIGSGKTTAIQCLCNMIKDKRILYLTYNTLLKIDAKNKISLSNVTVTNYHGFSVSILRKYNIKHSPNNSVQRILEIKPPLPKYDMIIIDEYQDIEEEFSLLLKYIQSYNPSMQIIAVGDMEQKIYDKTKLDVKQFIIDFLDNYESLYFTKCFRLSKDYASKLGNIWHKKINGVNKNCKVSIMTFDQVVNYLITQDTKDIICLGSRYKQLSSLLNTLEILRPDKFNKTTVYATIDDLDKDNVIPDSRTAIFTSYDSSKGMERKICVVTDFTKSYWETRTNQTMTKYDIVRNIFLVAASRGKEHIIFVLPNDKDKNGKKIKDLLLTEKILEQPTLFKTEINSAFNVSDMFGFKYIEDIMDCYRQLQIENIQTKGDIIEVQNKDGLIDLSPAIGIHCQNCFFKKFNLDSVIYHANMEQNKFITGYKNKDDQYKILCIVAANTHYQRYKYQVQTPFINKGETKLIQNRLSKIFNKNDIVEQPYKLGFEGLDDAVWRITGRCDVYKNNIPYELKFVHELSPEHYLQAAMYCVMSNSKYAILFNVKNNEMFKITVPDQQKFLDKVVNCITKNYVTTFKRRKLK